MAVRVPIVADYDPSGVKSAQAAFANFGQSVSKSLQQASRDARKNLGALSEGLDGAGSAADRLIASIGQTADRLDSELKRSRAAADALARSLGPDFTARVGQGGIERLVIDLRKAGLTLEEITADADRLGAALGQLDDVNLANVRGEISGLDAGVRKVGDSADRSRSVFANFTGNAAQEIPGVTGAFGPLNTAVGQFVEYASEGGIALSGLVASAAGIGAAASALFIINQQLDNVEASRALRREKVDNYFDGFKDGTKDLEDYAGALEAAANIRVPAGGIAGFFGLSKTRDLRDELSRLGYTWIGLARIVSGGAQAINAETEALKARGAAGQDVANLETYLYTQLAASTEAWAKATGEIRLNGGVASQVTDDQAGLAGAIRQTNTELKNQKTDADLAREALWNLRYATLGLSGIRFGFVGGDPSASGVEFGTGAPGSTRTQRATATANAATRSAIVNNYTVTVNGPIDAEQTAAAIRRVLNQSAQRNGIPQDYN